MKEVTYDVNGPLTEDEFVAVLKASTLGERRPVDDRPCIRNMLAHGNLTVTARVDGKLVGVARSLTDFSFVAYLSDLAVDEAFQQRGIGKRLIERTQDELGPRCMIVLLSAPAAVDYYPRIGFEKHPEAWIVPHGKRLP